MTLFKKGQNGTVKKEIQEFGKKYGLDTSYMIIEANNHGYTLSELSKLPEDKRKGVYTDIVAEYHAREEVGRVKNHLKHLRAAEEPAGKVEDLLKEYGIGFVSLEGDGKNDSFEYNSLFFNKDGVYFKDEEPFLRSFLEEFHQLRSDKTPEEIITINEHKSFKEEHPTLAKALSIGIPFMMIGAGVAGTLAGIDALSQAKQMKDFINSNTNSHANIVVEVKSNATGPTIYGALPVSVDANGTWYNGTYLINQIIFNGDGPSHIGEREVVFGFENGSLHKEISTVTIDGEKYYWNRSINFTTSNEDDGSVYCHYYYDDNNSVFSADGFLLRKRANRLGGNFEFCDANPKVIDVPISFPGLTWDNIMLRIQKDHYNPNSQNFLKEFNDDFNSGVLKSISLDVSHNYTISTIYPSMGTPYKLRPNFLESVSKLDFGPSVDKKSADIELSNDTAGPLLAGSLGIGIVTPMALLLGKKSSKKEQ